MTDRPLTVKELKLMFAATDDAETDREWMRVVKSVSRVQIESLRREAGEAGDLAMVEICDAALAGNETALLHCANAIADAAAMIRSSS